MRAIIRDLAAATKPHGEQPCAEGYETAQPLPQPKSRAAAKQCREMGLKVGDTIIGREGRLDWFNETKLTLLFMGEQVAAWKVTRRNNSLPKWRDDGETSNWTLNSRKWYLANDKDVPTCDERAAYPSDAGFCPESMEDALRWGHRMYAALRAIIENQDKKSTADGWLLNTARAALGPNK